MHVPVHRISPAGQEETGLEVEIRKPLGDITYWYVWENERIHKRVTFFLMEAVGGDISLHDREMEEVRWFPLSEALRLASFRSEQETREEFLALIRNKSNGI